MRRWSSTDIPTLDGRVAVVTGANSGIGYETALALASHGAKVIMTARSSERGSQALERLRTLRPDADVHLVLCDLADLASVEQAVAKITETADVLHILVNNAGVMAPPEPRLTVQGFELQLGTNHLGHFALTGRLLPLLLAQPGARVVTVASVAHRGASLDVDNLGSVANYAPRAAYGASKLANVLFFMELDRRARGGGESLVSVGAHPGWASTNIASAGPRLSSTGGIFTAARLEGLVVAGGLRFLGQSPARGALPSLYAATASNVSGGEYYGPDGPGELRGAPRLRRVTAAGRDPKAAAKLWGRSEELTGVSFTGLGAAR